MGGARMFIWLPDLTHLAAKIDSVLFLRANMQKAAFCKSP
jgi:hypothetical protein